MEHHPTLAPSKLDKLLLCPCYQSDKAPSVAARQGSYQHALAEHLFRGKEGDVFEHYNKLGSGEIENVRWYVDYVLANTTVNRVIEKKYALYDDDSLDEITFGTVDCFDISTKTIYDYKSGYKYSYETQMATYALMVMKHHGLTTLTTELCYGKLRTVDKFEWTLSAAYALFNKAKLAFDNPRKCPVPCKYCNWCGAKNSCPARMPVLKKIKAPFIDIDPKSITNSAQLNTLQSLAVLVEKWAKGVKDHTKEILSKGIKLPDWRLSKSGRQRQIINHKKACQRLGLSAASYMSCCKCSIEALEEVFAQTLGKDRVDREVKETLLASLGDAVEYTESSVRVVKNSKEVKK